MGKTREPIGVDTLIRATSVPLANRDVASGADACAAAIRRGKTRVAAVEVAATSGQ